MDTFFFALAGLIHVYIFTMESLTWGQPRTNKAFGVTPEMAAHNQMFAFNQGFYNLFLAFGIFAGIGFDFSDSELIGTTLKAFSGLCMFGASLVLIFSNSKLIRPALIQGLPPFLGLASLLIKTL